MKVCRVPIPLLQPSVTCILSATSAIGEPFDGHGSLLSFINFISDYKTDSIIQDSLRNELKGDITLITVAHRLQTIMDADKIVCIPQAFNALFF